MSAQPSPKRNETNYAIILLVAGVLVTVMGVYVAVVIPAYRWLAILFIVLSWLGVAAWYISENRLERKQVSRVVRHTWNRGRGWRVVAIAIGVIVAFLFVLGGCVFLLGWLVKSITVGGVRNLDLYLPKARRR